jgi:hypothetical protein
MDKNLKQDLRELFRIESIKIAIFLHSSKEKGENYDPFRNTGETTVKRNPIFIKAIVRDITPEKLILKEMGLSIAGSKELLIKTSDVGVIKASEKIEIAGQNYYKYHDAIGQKLLIFTRPYGYSRVIIFRKEID